MITARRARKGEVDPMSSPEPKGRNVARSASRRGAVRGATQPRPRKGAEKSQWHRLAIAAAALAEFCARGFAATRLDDVAKRAGVAKGTIYLHFRDKEALFREIVGTMLDPL